MRHMILATIVVLACAWPALAQNRPPTAPTRDVLVTYRATGPGQAQPQDIRVAFTASGNLMRVEGMGGPGGGAYVVVDWTTRRMVMVMPQDRRYMEMPANDAFTHGFILNDSMTFARRGSETVAGLKCTLWEVTSKEGAGTACMTDDGVLLRGRGNDGKGGIEATSVKYGPQPAALFKPPADYSKLEMPAGAPGGRAPGR